MATFRHKSGQVFIVPDAVIANYSGEPSPAAVDDASAPQIADEPVAPVDPPAPKRKRSSEKG